MASHRWGQGERSRSAAALANHGTLVFDRGDTWTHRHAISGTGTLVKSGSGTLGLATATGFAGTTTIRQGTLRLLVADALATSHVTPLAGGTLSLGRGLVSSAADAGGGRTIGWVDHGDGRGSVAWAVAGDMNLDGTVDVLDITSWMAAGVYDSGRPASWATGDFNYDGVSDLLDAVELMGGAVFDLGPYATPGAASAAVAVPEPAGAAAVGLALAACLVRQGCPARPGRARR